MKSDFFRAPIGLALSGGAMHGAWQSAVLKALETDHNLGFDAVWGFSSGALHATAYFLGLTDLGLERWSNPEKLRLLRFKPRLFPATLFSGRSIWEATAEAHDEEEARKRARCKLVIVSFSPRDRKSIYAVYEPGPQGRWDSPLSSHLVASCAIPRVFPPVRVSYRGRKVTLVDGGVRGPEPLSLAELSHCGDIIVIETTPGAGHGRTNGAGLRQRVLSHLERKTQASLRAAMDQAVSSLAGLKAPPRIFRLNPSRPLNFSMLSTKPEHIEPAIHLGYADAHAFMSAPERFLVQLPA